MNRWPTIKDIKNSACASLNAHLDAYVANEAKKQNKFHNKKVELDGYTFDSLKESKRYVELRTLQAMGEIKDLNIQIPFKLSVCTYIADFVYQDKSGRVVVEDVKGYKTKIYKLKRKLMQEELNIIIYET